MYTIVHNLKNIQEQITQAEQRFGRPPHSVRLLAVSKNQSIEKILQAVTAGQRAFGENYLQEALNKISALKNHHLEWHYIGALQTNKTRAIAENFAWAHSVDRLTIAQRLNDQRPASLPPLNICLQINLDQETNKAGIPLEAALDLATAITPLTQLKLRGLMAIPKPQKNFSDQRQTFSRLASTLFMLQKQGFTLDTLSMGMSDDFVAAIAEGATLVRIGTAIFGERK